MAHQMGLFHLSWHILVQSSNAPNTACTGQGRAVALALAVSALSADSVSGGFVRQFPPLPVTRAVRRFIAKH
jgi:hypothetical protein